MRWLAAALGLGLCLGSAGRVVACARRGEAWAEDVRDLALVVGTYSLVSSAVVFGLVFLVTLTGAFTPQGPPDEGPDR